MKPSGEDMPDRESAWSPKQIRMSHDALDQFLTPDVLTALAEGLREDSDRSGVGQAGVEAMLERRGIKLAPGVTIDMPVGPPEVDPPSIPPIVIGTLKPFRRCMTICHQIGPRDPRDPDPTRITICYVLCI
jgi:hypothetical protein